MVVRIESGERLKLKPGAYVPRGGCREFIYNRDPAVILVGAAETGKTLSACWKLHLLACKYPGAQFGIVRKTQKSLYGSVLQTWERIIKGFPVEIYGGFRPERYMYANGSTVWIGGMDNPDKVLSSERDVIYINQAEELQQNDWELLTTRTTGRGAVMPWTQCMGDCNPGGNKHWIRELAASGALTLLTSTHRDNPTLYTDAGVLTPLGERTMASLGALTGVRRKRLFEGVWATAEGAVYEQFDVAVHVLERDPRDFVSHELAIDEGYTNPAVILCLGIDSDGRRHVCEEWYHSHKLQAEVIAAARDMGRRYGTNVVAVDDAAAGLTADLVAHGMQAAPANKGRVMDGIRLVQDMLAVQGDGRPRLTVAPECVETINEFESYVCAPGKDAPAKAADHAMDCLRYHCVSALPPTEELVYVEDLVPEDELFVNLGDY